MHPFFCLRLGRGPPFSHKKRNLNRTRPPIFLKNPPPVFATHPRGWEIPPPGGAPFGFSKGGEGHVQSLKHSPNPADQNEVSSLGFIWYFNYTGSVLFLVTEGQFFPAKSKPGKWGIVFGGLMFWKIIQAPGLIKSRKKILSQRGRKQEDTPEKRKRPCFFTVKRLPGGGFFSDGGKILF